MHVQVAPMRARVGRARMGDHRARTETAVRERVAGDTRARTVSTRARTGGVRAWGVTYT